MDPFHPTPPVMPGTQDSPGQPPWCLWVGEWVSGPVCMVDTSLGCLPLAGLLLHQPVQSLRGLVRPVGLVYDRTEPSGTAFLLGRVRNWQACVLVSWRQGWNDSTVSLCHLLSPVTAPVSPCSSQDHLLYHSGNYMLSLRDAHCNRRTLRRDSIHS